MKKILLLFILFLCFVTTEVKASGTFNGLGNPVYGNSNWGAYCNARFCPWGNGVNFIGAKISLWYINNGNFYEVKTKSGTVVEPVYIVSSSISSTSYNNVKIDNNLNSFLSDKNTAYQNLANYFSGRFGTTGKNNGCTPIYDEQKKNSYFKEIFGVSIDKIDFGFDTEQIDCGNNKAEKGYRIIIEPLIRVSTSTINRTPLYYFFTVKELAEEGLNPKVILDGGGYVWNATNFTFAEMSKVFVTKVSDVGITAYTAEQCRSFGAAPAAGNMYKPLGAANVADKKTGCGYNIIDMTDILAPPKCYGQSTNKGNLICSNSDKNNVAYYNEEYRLLENCDNVKEEDKKRISENGKLMGESGTCKIYCKESAIASLPGNIIESKLRGTYFAWPSRPGDNGLYEMSLQIDLACKIEDTGKSEKMSATKLLECPTGYTEYNNDTCISLQTYNGDKCPTGFTNTGSSCVKYHCIFENKDYINGYLTDNQQKCVVGLRGQYDCPGGSSNSVADPSKCQMNAQKKPKCPDGWGNPIGTSSGYVCQKDAKKVYQYECPDGGDVSGTSCIKGISSYVKGCDSGWKQIGYSWGFQCERAAELVDGIVGYECPSGYSDFTGGACKKKTKPYNITGKIPVYGKVYTCKNYGGSRVGSTCVKEYDTSYVYYCSGSGWVKEGTSSGFQCRKDAVLSSTKYVYSCNGIGGSLAVNKCQQNATTYDGCPNSNWTLKSLSSGKICEISGTLKTKKINSQVLYSSYECGSNMIELGNKCHTTTNKVTTGYECPYGYSLKNDQCIKICDKNFLINSIKSQLNSAHMSAKVSGGTNKKIDTNLIQTGGFSNYDTNNLIFSKKTYLVLPDNVNRYQNIKTGEVFNTYSESYLNRNQGVISLGKNDRILENNKVKEYKLEIKNLKLGTTNQFGQEEGQKYVCNYTIKDTPTRDTPNTTNCKCPAGTKNAGDDVYEIYLQACRTPSSKTCSELQQLTCNSNKFENPGCGYYCINVYDGTKISLDSCIQNAQSTQKYTLQEAIYYCKFNTPNCNFDENKKRKYCQNIKTGKNVDITNCLNTNSPMSCYKEYGCILDVCEANKCCTGKCSWEYKETKQTIYGIQSCNNNNSSLQNCSFEVYCKDSEKETSQSMHKCVQSKLNSQNVLKDYKNKINAQQLKKAVEDCEKSICSSNHKAIYRVIDLNNPFPGKLESARNDLSLTGSKNRNPGSNWDSNTAVKNEILYARGTAGYELYKKEPIVTITLTPSVIKEIRKYNKTKTYDDFNLKCLNNSKSAGCISYFLHKNTTINGMNIKWHNNCSNLNTSSNLETFDKCYNSNN